MAGGKAPASLRDRPSDRGERADLRASAGGVSTGAPAGRAAARSCGEQMRRRPITVIRCRGLAEAGIEASVGSVGESYDNALAETYNDLYKTGLVHRQGPWRNMQDMEIATLGWVDWFDTRRLPGLIGNIPPAEAEENFYAQRDVLDMVA